MCRRSNKMSVADDEGRLACAAQSRSRRGGSGERPLGCSGDVLLRALPSGYRSRRNGFEATAKEPTAPSSGRIDLLVDAPRATRTVRVQRGGAVIAPAKVNVGQRAFKHDHAG